MLPRPTTEMNGSDESIAVIIPTLDAAVTLGRCLDSIKEQTVPATEVIVVDDVATTDETRRLAKDRGAKVIVSPANMAESRNVGIAAARSRLLVNIDADMILSANVLREVRSTLCSGLADVVTIKEIGIGRGYWARARALDKAAVEYLGQGRAVRAFLREIFETVGRFDVPAWEDWDFTNRTLKHGARLRHIEAAVIYHDEGQLKLRKALERKYRYGLSARGFVDRYGLASAVGGLALRTVTGVRLGVRTDRMAVLGLIVLKALDVLAGAAGMVVASVRIETD